MHIFRNRTGILMALDIIAFEVVYWVTAFVSTHSSTSVDRSLLDYTAASVVLLMASFAVRVFLGVYHNVWRYANSRAYLMMVGADTFGGIIGSAI